MTTTFGKARRVKKGKSKARTQVGEKSKPSLKTPPAAAFFLSPKLHIGASGRKGRGVFAKKAIVKGEVLEIAPALLVPTTEEEAFLKTFLEQYIFRTDQGDRYIIGLGYTSIFNHGVRANAEFFVDNLKITMKATRAIAAGIEITVNYGWTADEWAKIGGQLK